jgi:carotenoid cleavage dioxygenase
MTDVQTQNSFLTGNYAPVRTELTVFDLPVRGAVPRELNGRLLRNGPNPIQVDDPVRYHWFLGDGMVHAIELRDGRAVSYRNRWVRTDKACAALGEDPPAGQPDDCLPGASVANTNVIEHAGRILTLVEVCLPTEITPDLETVGRYDFNGKLRSAMTAHPKEDPVTGELVFFGYNPIAPPYLRYHVAGADGSLVRSEDIDIPGPAMVHDFAITEHYAVFFDLPVVFDFEKLAGREAFPAVWTPDYGARIGVMPRDGGNADVVWIDLEPCYVFHSLNAYEQDGSVVVDVCRYPTMFAPGHVGPDAMPTLDRWTIDLAARKIREERIDERGQEFPRIDDRRMGRAHRFGYSTGLGTGDDGFRLGGTLNKHDLHAGTSDVRDLGPGRAASEAVFVASGDAEDDGYVLALVYDQATDASELHIVHAQDFTGDPAAVVELPQRVPFGFHGDWVPDAL